MNFEELKQEILNCRDCQKRFGFEPHPIMRGNPSAKIMQISQAPSLTVYQTLLPFSDLSGKKLKEQWYQISEEDFYNPDNFYITSIAHCYPGRSPSGGDRQPPIACARKWLNHEIECVDNELYILIGAKAAGFFFSKENFTDLVFSDKELNGKPVIILPHPSPLNIKWFKDNPTFETKRLPKVRELVHKVLKS